MQQQFFTMGVNAQLLFSSKFIFLLLLRFVFLQKVSIFVKKIFFVKSFVSSSSFFFEIFFSRQDVSKKDKMFKHNTKNHINYLSSKFSQFAKFVENAR
jgi:hypothetical protein